MTQQQLTSSITRLLTVGALAAMVTACITSEPEEQTGSGKVTEIRYDKSGKHRFEVEVHYDRAKDSAAARWLLTNLEIVPAKEVFGDTSGLREPMLAGDDARDQAPVAATAGAADDDAPHLEVKLYPMDSDLAPHEYAWTITQTIDTRSLGQSVPEAGAGLGSKTQQLTSFWWVNAWQTVTGPRYRCYAFSSTVLMLSGLSGAHYIYRGRDGLHQVMSFPAYIGIPSPLAAVDFTQRYYRTKFRMDVAPGLIQVTNTCM